MASDSSYQYLRLRKMLERYASWRTTRILSKVLLNILVRHLRIFHPSPQQLICYPVTIEFFLSGLIYLPSSCVMVIYKSLDNFSTSCVRKRSIAERLKNGQICYVSFYERQCSSINKMLSPISSKKLSPMLTHLTISSKPPYIMLPAWVTLRFASY